MSTTLTAVKKGIAFIEANLQRNIFVADVADAVSYSQFYFSREFSRHAHISIYDYILRRKITEAYKCLFQTDTKIVDLAFRYGFQSHEVFTRAFRKIFGENPSEAAVFKPLAVFEMIDDRYLEFLNGLRTDTNETAAEPCYFEVDSGADMDDGCSRLTLLDKKNFYRRQGVFNGTITTAENGCLSFRLCRLRRKIRIYHTDEQQAFRYFLDNAFDADEMVGNYILQNKEDDHVDFFAPKKEI
jgi:AraC-like DNA-binding protein